MRARAMTSPEPSSAPIHHPPQPHPTKLKLTPLPPQFSLAPTMAALEATQTIHCCFGYLDDKNFQLHGRSLLLLIIIFSIILFIIILCLYMRWACRYRRWTTANGAGDLSSVAGLPRPLGLDAETIGSFPVRLHRSSPSGEEAQCSICLSCLIEGEKVKVLPSCSHAFHPECIDEWLKTHTSCPLCRSSLGGSTTDQPVAADVRDEDRI